MKIVCLDGYTTNPGDLSWKELEELGDFTVYDRTPKDKLIDRAYDADIIVTNKVILEKEELDKLPNLKYISMLATGYNTIDVEYARTKGIPVSNAPDYSTKAVAQHTFAFILEIHNNIALHSQSVKNGDWVNSPDFCYWKKPVMDLNNKTIGIIGYGKIGQEVAKIANSFGMNIKILKRNKNYETDSNITFCNMDELLSASDIVSLHCPANKETIGMVNREFLSKMKNTAVLINLSRGVLVNEADLADALNNGVIGYGAIDVISTEPAKPDNPLLTAKNIFITPHIAWASEESRKKLITIMANNIKGFITNNQINIVN